MKTQYLAHLLTAVSLMTVTSGSSFSFGKDANTLVLMPKGKSQSRFMVNLNPKTNLPVRVAIHKKLKGQSQCAWGSLP